MRKQKKRIDIGKSRTEKFENRVSKTETCWLWTGTLNPQTGYGQLFCDGKYRLAHRVSYELHVGPIADGLLVCHHCDNPPCVNPAHLYSGTHIENMADKSRRGRWRGGAFNGERNHNAKLSSEQVLEIRGLFKLPYFKGKYAEMGAAFGVAPCVIDHIKAGRSWKTVP